MFCRYELFVLMFFLFFYSVSKPVLNSMLKDPSLIPDQVLAKNIYQVRFYIFHKFRITWL